MNDNPGADARDAVRKALNRDLGYLTAANLGLLLLWWFLARQYDGGRGAPPSAGPWSGLHWQLVAAAAVTLLVWLGLAVAAVRRLAFWLRHER